MYPKSLLTVCVLILPLSACSTVPSGGHIKPPASLLIKVPPKLPPLTGTWPIGQPTPSDSTKSAPVD